MCAWKCRMHWNLTQSLNIQGKGCNPSHVQMGQVTPEARSSCGTPQQFESFRACVSPCWISALTPLPLQLLDCRSSSARGAALPLGSPSSQPPCHCLHLAIVKTWEFAILGSIWITTLLIYYNSVQEKWQAFYISTCTGSCTENRQLLESTSLSLTTFRHMGRGS